LMTTAPSATPAGISAEADALRALYADWSQLLTSMPDLPMRLLRSIFDEWHQPTREPEDVSYREDDVGGVPGLWALPAGADTSQVDRKSRLNSSHVKISYAVFCLKKKKI